MFPPPPKTPGKCEYHLEVLHIQDTTGSYVDDVGNLKKNFADITAELKLRFPKVKYSLAAFKDKPITDLGHDIDFCLRVHLPMAPIHVDTAVKGFDKLNIGGGGQNDWPENSMGALLRGAVSPQVGWSTPGDEYDSSGRPIAKVIILSTDAMPHLAGDVAALSDAHLQLPPFNVTTELMAEHGENSGCTEMEYPTVEDVRHALLTGHIFPLFILAPGAFEYDGKLWPYPQLKKLGYTDPYMGIRHYYEDLLTKQVGIVPIIEMVNSEMSDVIESLRRLLDRYVSEICNLTSTSTPPNPQPSTTPTILETVPTVTTAVPTETTTASTVTTAVPTETTTASTVTTAVPTETTTASTVTTAVPTETTTASTVKESTTVTTAVPTTIINSKATSGSTKTTLKRSSSSTGTSKTEAIPDATETLTDETGITPPSEWSCVQDKCDGKFQRVEILFLHDAAHLDGSSVANKVSKIISTAASHIKATYVASGSDPDAVRFGLASFHAPSESVKFSCYKVHSKLSPDLRSLENGYHSLKFNDEGRQNSSQLEALHYFASGKLLGWSEDSAVEVKAGLKNLRVMFLLTPSCYRLHQVDPSKPLVEGKSLCTGGDYPSMLAVVKALKKRHIRTVFFPLNRVATTCYAKLSKKLGGSGLSQSLSVRSDFENVEAQVRKAFTEICKHSPDHHHEDCVPTLPPCRRNPSGDKSQIR